MAKCRQPCQVVTGHAAPPVPSTSAAPVSCDASLEAALLREVREEIAGEAADLRPFCQLENDKGEAEDFYTAKIVSWNFDDRTGPEFQCDDRGEYLLEEVPLTIEAIDALNLMLPQVKGALLDAVRAGSLTAPVA